MRGKVLATWWLTCLLWSSVWVFIKVGVTDVPPISLAGLRLALAIVLLLPLLWRIRGSVPRSWHDWSVIAATGVVLLGINYALVFWGAQFIASGTTAVLQAATPAFGILFARWFGTAKTTGEQLLGVALGVAGVAALSAHQFRASGKQALAGALAVAIGGACVAFAYTVVKIRLSHVPSLVILVGQMVSGCIPLLIAGRIFEGDPRSFHWTATAVAALLYLAVAGSIAAFWLNLWLLRRSSTSSILAMSIVEPLLAVAIGAAFLSERFPPVAWLGAGLILVSVWLVVVRPESAAG